MARQKRLAVCKRCGRQYVVSRYNHEQKYCRDEACVTERRRARQRHYYQGKYRRDAAFRDAEQQRCRQGAQRRRQARASTPAAAPGAVAILPGVDAECLTAGMVAQLIGSDDPEVVLATARALVARGQRVAVAAAATGRAGVRRGPPTFPLHELEAKRGVPLHELEAESAGSSTRIGSRP